MTPATAAFPAMVAKRFSGQPYVLIVQDIWPDSVFASGFLERGIVRKVAERLLSAFVDRAYRGADHVVVISPGMRRVLVARGVPDSKISLVYNWVDEETYRPRDADPELRASLGLTEDDFIVMYAGNHGAAQGLHTLVDAISQIDPDQRCHAVLVGDGVAKVSLQELARKGGSGRVHFLPPVSPDELATMLPAADIQLVSLIDQPLFHLTMPGKVQAILAAGQAALISAPGDAAQLVVEAEAGLASAAGDSVDLARCIGEARAIGRHGLAKLGANGRRMYLEHMSSKVGSQRLSRILDDARATPESALGEQSAESHAS